MFFRKNWRNQPFHSLMVGSSTSIITGAGQLQVLGVQRIFVDLFPIFCRRKGNLLVATDLWACVVFTFFFTGFFIIQNPEIVSDSKSVIQVFYWKSNWGIWFVATWRSIVFWGNNVFDEITFSAFAIIWRRWCNRWTRSRWVRGIEGRNEEGANESEALKLKKVYLTSEIRT